MTRLIAEDFLASLVSVLLGAEDYCRVRAASAVGGLAAGGTTAKSPRASACRSPNATSQFQDML